MQIGIGVDDGLQLLLNLIEAYHAVQHVLLHERLSAPAAEFGYLSVFLMTMFTYHILYHCLILHRYYYFGFSSLPQFQGAFVFCAFSLRFLGFSGLYFLLCLALFSSVLQLFDDTFYRRLLARHLHIAQLGTECQQF